jgi:hypothetical protein
MRFVTNSTRPDPRRHRQPPGAHGSGGVAPASVHPGGRGAQLSDRRKLTPHLLVHADVQGEFADLLGPRPARFCSAMPARLSSYEALNRVLPAAVGRLPLLAMGSNRYFRDGNGLSLDIGPFMAALEYAAEMEAVVLGKPSPVFSWRRSTASTCRPRTW